MTLLAMALEAQGYHAMSFTGRRRASARTGRTTRRKSSACDPTASWRRSTKGIIPVIAGFQGIDDNDDMTTLGRGGSDTTAVAVAWGINADVCEIYSDVEGVFTADPRVCPRAKKLDQISYDDMLELAGAGAACSSARPSSSPANGTSSSIPVRRFPTPRARISRRLPTWRKR